MELPDAAPFERDFEMEDVKMETDSESECDAVMCDATGKRRMMQGKSCLVVICIIQLLIFFVVRPE